MTIRHLHLTTSSVVALGFATQPEQDSNKRTVEELEKRSSDSAHMEKYWDKVDAILDGLDGMKMHAESFLPKFRNEDNDDYKFRLQCATMTNVYEDIVGSLAAKPFEQAIQLIESEDDAKRLEIETPLSPVPQEIKDFCWNVDGSGNNLTVFAAHTFYTGINNAIDWIMVDMDKRDPSVVSIADAKRRGLTPYWSHILARNVLDVRSKMEGNKEVLTYAKILEPGDPDHIREFERADDGVEWRLWRKLSEGNAHEYVLVDSGEVSIGVIPLVKFVTGRREGRQWRFKPPMQAAVELQIQMFKQESGLEHASQLTAYPMLAANGVEAPVDQTTGKPDYKVAVGPNRVLWSRPSVDGAPAGNWSYVEPGSESLKFLEQRISNTEQRLRELGRQPLTASSSNITVITAAVAAGKAKSAVKQWAYMLKDTLENALIMTCAYMGIGKYDPTVHVFAEFDDWMEGEDIEALLEMHKPDDAGRRAISTKTLHEEMQRRGVLSSNFTSERETIRLLAEYPSDGMEEPNPPEG